MIVVRLRETIRAHEARTGEKLTYAELAARAGIARATIESLASRPAYNATLETIDKLCSALECGLTDLVQYQPTQRPTSRGTNKRARR